MDDHNLSTEFPEYKEAIHTLKTENAHFKVLFDRFQEIDKTITRAEQRIELISEIEEEKLRKERLKIKEDIYKILKEFDSK